MSWIKNGNVPRVMLPTAIFPRLVAGAPAARVYGALAMRADNKSGLSDSTREQIAEDAQMSVSQVREGLRKLLAEGWITKVRQGNSSQSNKYQLHTSPKGSEIRPVEGSEIRPVLPQLEQSEIRQQGGGNPSPTGRKSTPPLVSPGLVSPSLGEVRKGDQPDDGAQLALVEEAPTAPQQPAKPKSRAAHIPEDFAPTESMLAWANSDYPSVDAKFETERFVDYWLQEGGSKALKRDWNAAWRTWIRNEFKFASERSGRQYRASQRGQSAQRPGGFANDQDRRIAEFLGATGSEGPGLIALPGGQQ